MAGLRADSAQAFQQAFKLADGSTTACSGPTVPSSTRCWPAGRGPSVALLSGSVFLCIGCQGGPLIPPVFGPPLDNLFGILILMIVGVVLYRLLAPRFKASRRGHSFPTPETIARERFARGEISQEEYERILQILSPR